MKRSRKIYILLVAIVAILTAFSLCGCSLFGKKEKLYETEYFKYGIYGTAENPHVTIKGLTELGLQQEYLVIPEEIDGMPVEVYTGFDEPSNLKLFYVSYTITNINCWVVGHNAGRVFLTTHEKTIYINSQYVKSSIFSWGGIISSVAEENFRKHDGDSFELKYKIADIQYMYNYDDSPNMGVHFIDDVEVGEKVHVIPVNPKREGYTFVGWFREPECVNAVDLKTYQKEDEEILSLYACWRENR